MKNKIDIYKVLHIFAILCLVLLLANCGTTKEAVSISEEEKKAFNAVEGDTISISNEEAEYEIIIIEPGFNAWLASVAQPEGYYSQSFLENRNFILVQQWNQRVMLPLQFDPQLYQMQIDYVQNIDYGYEVNYKLYNYLIYFQRKYNQRLSSFLPRI